MKIQVAAIATLNGFPLALFRRPVGALGPVYLDRSDFADSAWSAAVMTAGECERAGADEYMCAHDPLLSSGALRHARAGRFLLTAVQRVRRSASASDDESVIVVGSDEMQRLYGETRPVRKRWQQGDSTEPPTGMEHWNIARSVEEAWAYWSARFFADACGQAGYGCIIGIQEIEVRDE